MSELLTINSKNILGWLQLITEVYPLEEEDKQAIYNFIHRRDIVRRTKELEDIFGGEDD